MFYHANDNEYRVSEQSKQILNGTSGYTVSFTSVYAGKYLTEDKSKTGTTKTKHRPNPGKANNTKPSKTKLAWFSRLLRHSAKKRGGLILQCSRAHTGSRTAWVVYAVPWRRTTWVIGVLGRGTDGEVVVVAYSV